MSSGWHTLVSYMYTCACTYVHTHTHTHEPNTRSQKRRNAGARTSQSSIRTRSLCNRRQTAQIIARVVCRDACAVRHRSEGARPDTFGNNFGWQCAVGVHSAACAQDWLGQLWGWVLCVYVFVCADMYVYAHIYIWLVYMSTFSRVKWSSHSSFHTYILTHIHTQLLYVPSSSRVKSRWLMVSWFVFIHTHLHTYINIYIRSSCTCRLPHGWDRDDWYCHSSCTHILTHTHTYTQLSYVPSSSRAKSRWLMVSWFLRGLSIPCRPCLTLQLPMAPLTMN